MYVKSLSKDRKILAEITAVLYVLDCVFEVSLEVSSVSCSKEEVVHRVDVRLSSLPHYELAVQLGILEVKSLFSNDTDYEVVHSY